MIKKLHHRTNTWTHDLYNQIVVSSRASLQAGPPEFVYRLHIDSDYARSGAFESSGSEREQRLNRTQRASAALKYNAKMIRSFERLVEMQFLVLGYDGTDSEALARRLAVREEHLAMGDRMKAAGKWLCGAAILDDQEKMIGSVIICDYESREELDAWLKDEPYVKGNVWQKIEVTRCKVGPSFRPAKV